MQKKVNHCSGISVFVIIASMLFFSFIMCIVYIPKHKASSVDAMIVEKRKETLRAVMTKEQHLTHAYEWIDQEKNIVRIPVDRAIDLMLIESRNVEPHN